MVLKYLSIDYRVFSLFFIKFSLAVLIIVSSPNVALASNTTQLFVHTSPVVSKIRILNIKPKFKQGIELQVGENYTIEASSPGYITKVYSIKLSLDNYWQVIVLERSNRSNSIGQIKNSDSVPLCKPSKSLHASLLELREVVAQESINFDLSDPSLKSLKDLIRKERFNVDDKYRDNFFDIKCHMALQGDPTSILSVAIDYGSGFGVKKDLKQEFKILTNLSNEDISEELKSHIMYLRGLSYRDGLGVKMDKQKGLYLLTKAAELNHDQAMVELGIMHLIQNGAPEDYQLAVKYLTKAQSIIHPHEISNFTIYAAFGYMKFFGLGVPIDKERGLEEIQRSQYRFNAFGYYALARAYYCGCSTLNKDYNEAKRNFQRAINLGYTDAYYDLGFVLWRQQEFNQAVDIFRLGASLGNAKSGFIYAASLYNDGLMSEYEYWSDMAIDSGSKLAIITMADRFEWEDPKQIPWLIKAAKLGSEKAIIRLSDSYYEGVIVEEDNSKAYNLAKLVYKLNPSYVASEDNNPFLLDQNETLGLYKSETIACSDEYTVSECVNRILSEYSHIKTGLEPRWTK